MKKDKPRRRTKSVYEVARDADLEASGLNSAAIVKKLGLGIVRDEKETKDLLGIDGVMSYEIPYYGIDGRPMGYSRWKLISVTDKDPGLKYFQFDKTIPRIYFPPLTDWTTLARDATKRLVVTEGEKKAACAVLNGIPALGLGGVWNWTSRKWGYDQIPDFDSVLWKERDVEICFDSDMTDNANVAKAQDKLVAALTRRGARVFIRRLERTQSGKTGLDDFIVAEGASAYESLPVAEAPQSRELSAMNERAAYLEEQNSFVSLEDGVLLRTEGEFTRRFGIYQTTSESGKLVPITGPWMLWDLRRTLRKISHIPGKPKIHGDLYNTWRDTGVPSKKGSVSILLDIVREIEKWDWLLQWLAYPVQNPGAKLNQAVLIWSIEQRTGKSLIGDVTCDVYGPGNFSRINSEQLHDPSLDWMAKRQFIHGNEIFVGADRADLGILKDLITRSDVRINEKYVPKYTVPNTANFYMTSNQPDAIKLEDADRRFFVGALDKQYDVKFWNEVDKWRAKGGASHWRWYLENEVDCASFDPTAPAPYTEEKGKMTDIGRGDLELWCRDFVARPLEHMGALAKMNEHRDVYTAQQIMAFLPESIASTIPRGVSLTLLSRHLVKAGAVRLHSPVVCSDGKQRRFIAIRNLKRWKELQGNRNAWVRNFEAGRPAISRLVVSESGEKKEIAENKVTPFTRKKR